MKTAFFSKVEYKYIVAFIYICVLFLDRVDVTIVNVAMPTFAESFSVKITETEWISTGFLLALASVVPISGWAGDKFGLKKIFVLASALFTLGSMLCAFAWSLESLVLFRVLQGIGGGMLVPVGMSMTYRAFPQHEFSKAASYTLMPTLIGPSIAPALGGFVLEHFSWRWLFLFNVPIGLIATISAISFLKEDKSENTPNLDWLGFVYSSSALVFLLFALSRVGHFGLADFWFRLCMSSSVILFILFYIQEKRINHPLIDLKFFKIKLFVQANLIQICLQICHFGSLFLVAVYLQVGLGMSTFWSGLAMSAQPFGSILMLPISARFFNIYGPKYSIVFGMLGLSVTTYAICFVQNATQLGLAVFILWVRGLVIGFINGPIQACALFDINRMDTSRASSVFNAGRQVAISLGVALTSLVLAFGYRTFHLDNHSKFSSLFPIFENAFIMLSFISAFGAMIALSIDNKKILEKVKKMN